MKYFALLAALSLATTINTVYATEVTSSDDEAIAYCNEQGELSGIENTEEKKQYIKDCIESVAPQLEDNQQSVQE